MGFDGKRRRISAWGHRLAFAAMLCALCILMTSCGCDHENTAWQDKHEATCTEDGYTGDLYCYDCEKIIEKGKSVKAEGHVAVQGWNASEATCTVPGYTGDTYCERCHDILEFGTEIPALGHTLVPLGNGEEPTCNRKGYSGDSSCSVCQAVITGETIPTVEHDFQENVCSFCGWMTPGLYQDDKLVMTWEELKAGGYAVVDNGSLLDLTGDYGMGKVVIGEDVTALKSATDTGGIKTVNASEVWLPATLTNLGSYKMTNKTIQKLVLFGTATIIPADCFNAAYTKQSLQSLVLPDTVKILENRAIAHRPLLTDFPFPSALEVIGCEAFYDCGLTDVVLPEGVKTVALRAFSASALRSIRLPASLEELDSEAFALCKNLETVDMSACENITELDYGLFRQCNSLTTLRLPPNLKAFDDSYNLFGSDTYLPILALEFLDLPEGFVSFGAERFKNVKLTSIVWPASLVDGTALADCPLGTIYYTGTEAQWAMVRGHDSFPDAQVIFEYQRS